MSEWQHRIPGGFHNLHGTSCPACGHPLHRHDAVLLPRQAHQDCSQPAWPVVRPCKAKHGGYFCAKPEAHDGSHRSCGGVEWVESPERLYWDSGGMSEDPEP